MDEYKKYLAERLFTEDKMVTYRTLSRALKVHVNAAKAMLYEFHSWQNSIAAGKVHATYIILGTRKPTVQSDGDVEMASSAPEAEYWDGEAPTQSLTLVTEERLKDVLAEYSAVTSFAVYSLAAHPIKELQLLTDVSREALQVGEDNAEDAKTYGTISNPGMKKRTRQGKRPSPAAAPAPAEKKPALAKPAPAVKAEPAAEVKDEPKPAASASTATPAASAASTKKVAPAPKKNSIMNAFSKAKPRKAGSAASTPKMDTQSPALSDDGEDDEAPMPAPLPKKAEDGTARRSRQDREAELKRMMEEESDEEEEEEEKEEDEPMEEAPEPEAEADQEPAEVLTSSGTGRRRGKRQVMKKIQKMDKDGYLVTTQEKVWEEFSEDDTPAPTAAPAAAPAASAKTKSTAASTPAASGTSSTAKGKKAGPKVQGNIMSFFSKK
ncbi:DNA polymerase subunit Cdc27 [Plectosphaerella plurivora]|uniref:DNA polymerase delta subunit 3 n=1 Tax=Plectosphaerella plurivora TaxID=936078 RepID=A0A9P8V2J4_9PEZI|nr:DNA polymerase subunit Cdc27 [Plectosphaerella plurivora]